VLSLILGAVLLLSGLALFGLLRFVKLEVQRRILRMVGWFDVVSGCVAIGLGLAGQLP
jgi:hypothetical protein